MSNYIKLNLIIRFEGCAYSNICISLPHILAKLVSIELLREVLVHIVLVYRFNETRDLAPLIAERYGPCAAEGKLCRMCGVTQQPPDVSVVEVASHQLHVFAELCTQS